MWIGLGNLESFLYHVFILIIQLQLNTIGFSLHSLFVSCSAHRENPRFQQLNILFAISYNKIRSLWNYTIISTNNKPTK